MIKFSTVSFTGWFKNSLNIKLLGQCSRKLIQYLRQIYNNTADIIKNKSALEIWKREEILTYMHMQLCCNIHWIIVKNVWTDSDSLKMQKYTIISTYFYYDYNTLQFTSLHCLRKIKYLLLSNKDVNCDCLCSRMFHLARKLKTEIIKFQNNVF